MNFLYIFLGGGIGSLLRYIIGLTFQKSTMTLPLATLTSNIIACLIFAFTINFMQSKSEEGIWKALVLTGFCGGLSTFSTFGYETWLLLKQQNYWWMGANMIISMAACILCFFLIRK